MGVFKKSQDYYIDYYVNGGRKREKIGPNRKLAEAVLHKRKTEIAEGKFLDIRKDKKIKFKDFADTYLETHAKPNKKSWFTSDVKSLRNLVPFFGEKYLYGITPMMVEQYKIERKQKVSAASVNRELALLKGMFNKAIDWNLTEGNPVKKVKLFKENNARTRFLEKEEIKKLLEQCSQRLKPIVILALHTGMRKGEIRNLKWSDIDIQRGMITLRDTKNGEIRHSLMNETVKRALIFVRKHPQSSFVFCKEDASPDNFRKAFETAVKNAGIKDFRFHDLRHTFASHLVMAGIGLNTVKELLGHKTINMTLRYSHLSPDHKAQAVEVLGRKLMDTNMDTKPFYEKIESSQVYLNK